MDNKVRVEKCSICRVIARSSSGMEGDTYLERLFDVEDNRLFIPIINEEAPRKFENRTWIYKNDGPNSIGFIGCWRWSAKPNRNDPEADYVQSAFSHEIKPIFIDSIAVQDNEQLVTALKKEYRISATARNGNGIILIYDKRDSRCYQGVYIPPEKMIEIETGDFILSPDALYLRTVMIDRADVLPFGNEKIYRFLNVNLGGTLLIKSPFEVIKQYFLKNATWKTYSRMVGGTHAEHNELKAFIESINESIEVQIARECGISEDDASSYINKFMNEIEKYFSSKDLETEALQLLLTRDENLRTECEKVAEACWKEENAKIVKNAEENISILEKTLEETKSELEQKQIELRQANVDLEKWKENHRRLEEEFDEEIQKKIQNAKHSVGGLLADTVYGNELLGTSGRTASKSTKINYCSGELKETEETFNKIEDAHDLLTHNLHEFAGVNEDYAPILSSILLATFENHIPMVLAGPNGKAIAEAFSHTLFSFSCGCLECNEEYSKDVQQCIFDAPDPVICIDGFTNFNWLHSVPDICSCREKTLFFLTPYFEELFLAPKGLMSYVFPISTSEFVEELPTEDYIAGLYNGGQEEVRYAESERKILELNDLGMARTLQKKYQRLYASAKAIMANRRKNTLMRYMTLLIPYAVLAGTSEKLKEIASTENLLSDEDKNDLVYFLGVE